MISTSISPDRKLPLSFYIVMAAQFFSAMADNALLIAAIAMLKDFNSPEEIEPLLKLFFVVPYVLLAAFVGAFADALPKGQVMLLTNAVKIVGCLLLLNTDIVGYNIDINWMFVTILASYALVGFGASAYSPAKYGILTELLPHNKLVLANGWVEGLTVSAIVLGTLLGGVLINEKVADALVLRHMSSSSNVDSPAEAAMLVIVFVYIIAALLNLLIPRTSIALKPVRKDISFLVRDFAHCVRLLWVDKLGQITLAVTSLFWGAGAVLQFLVIKWGNDVLGLPLEKSALLQGVTAFGIVVGAAIAAVRVPLKNSLTVLPAGALIGVAVLAMVFVHSLLAAVIVLLVVGALGGYFIVPMNALLQHRGHVLMGAGHSIAVQNFNENISILVMLGLYSALLYFNPPVEVVVGAVGGFLIFTIGMVFLWHRRNMNHLGSEINILLNASMSFHGSSEQPAPYHKD